MFCDRLSYGWTAQIAREFTMQTHGHYVINMALLGKTIAPKHNIAIAIGSVLPDIPIFLFYVISKFIYKMPEAKIWGEAYYQPVWQNIIATSHSIPIALIGFIICWFFDWKWGAILCVSMVCHCLLDLPVHHDDAHRHFYPFSDYRFNSPVSYWDVNHHAKIAAGVEFALVLIATPFVMGLLRTPYTKGILILIDIAYLLTYSGMLGINLLNLRSLKTLGLIAISLVTPFIVFFSTNKEKSLEKLQYYKIPLIDKFQSKKDLK